MLPRKPGSSDSPRGCTKQEPKHGSIISTRVTSSLRRQVPVTLPVLTVRERSDPKLWTSASSARLLTKHLLTALGVSPSTYLVNPSFMRDGRTLSHTLKPRIAATASYLQQMVQRSMLELMTSSPPTPTKCSGPGVPKPSLHQPPRRN